jgi:heterodisulfide reductase subunit B
MKLAYYPGCSLQSSSDAYDISVRAVCDGLGIELKELNDWNCCGATEASALNQVMAYSIIARNLALVEPDYDQLIAPCAACYLNLKKTDKVMAHHPKIADKVGRALAAGELSYQPGRVTVRHLLEVIYSDIGEKAVKEKLERPLYGLRVAPYYGCQFVRPNTGVDDPEQPKKLDEMMSWIGATVVDYPLKSHCCGGHMTQISDEMSNELIWRLLKNAQDHNVDVIACMCPMCQLNLDAYQNRVNSVFNTNFSIPIMYFTQLMGVALGFESRKLGLGKEIIPLQPVLDQKLLKEPVKEPVASKKSKDRKSLPMPSLD